MKSVWIFSVFKIFFMKPFTLTGKFHWMNEQIFPVFWICYYIWQQVCGISKCTSTLIVHIVKYYFISDTAQKLLWVNGFSVSLDVIPTLPTTVQTALMTSWSMYETSFNSWIKTWNSLCCCLSKCKPLRVYMLHIDFICMKAICWRDRRQNNFS